LLHLHVWFAASAVGSTDTDLRAFTEAGCKRSAGN
jgi:hypothetical protein